MGILAIFDANGVLTRYRENLETVVSFVLNQRERLHAISWKGFQTAASLIAL
jgi:hypothetical protein